MILVTGATGNAGGAVIRALLGSDAAGVRGLVRREADRSRLPPGVEAVTGDLNEPDTLRAPLRASVRCSCSAATKTCPTRWP